VVTPITSRATPIAPIDGGSVVKRSKLSRRRVSRAAASVAVVALVGSGLAACGGDDSSAKDQSKYNTMSVADLGKDADKEGTVTWYTTFSSDDVDPMLAAFNKAYPDIKVKALRLSADQIAPRMITEQKGGKYNADVVSGEAIEVSQLRQAGALQPYDAPDQPPVPAGLTMSEGYQAIIYVNTTVLAYNPTAVQAKGLTPPTTWEDLTKPEWKGQFSIDPSAVNWYDSLVKWLGHDKALDLVKRLGANSPVFVESHTEALTQVQSGEPLATATAYGYSSSEAAQDTPDQLKFINNNPLPGSLTMASLGKNAPHPAAARLFEDWLVSQAGQEQVVQITNHASIRDDVDNDPAVWDPATFPPVYCDPDLDSKTFNAELKEYDDALGAES
jgi:iron(III) transport system substrate-binding protein